MYRGGNNNSFRPSVSIPAASTMVSPTEEMSPSVSRERVSQQQQLQWTEQETKDLIGIRGELEKDFTIAKRNKALWEIVSAKMRERGYRRTPDQCKCKWKNLVNRYKGKETSDPENGLHCPFFKELHTVFNERAKNMQRLLFESEAGSTQAKKRAKRMSVDRSLNELSEDEDEDENGSGGEERLARTNSRKRKGERILTDMSSRVTITSNPDIGSIHEMLKEFFQWQQQMELQWREMMERRAHEQQLFEQEWRQSMEKIERERLMIEQAFREREEQRRIREESRAERRDALLTILLNKLIHENDI
ncbi:hypothetical protein JCGZ_02761 [Jatropha curcas]|uniref:Myb-like domain-containing protein n=1 Tax=Jatropha curcas TaxID=180498 RepID=A0A067KU78_JATCU|nr:trihelix transcription factor GT-3b [Jatropha curcas]KDP39741.1 hypothetical protein JCGZ_02761 [Jatropha curcas]